MPRAFLSGLRGRLLLLVILAVLPAFGLSLYASWRDRQHQLRSVVEDTVRLARVVATDQERIIEGTRQILSDLAAIPEVRAGDGARARTLFSLLMKQWRGYASFTLIDPAGKVIVSLPAPIGTVDFAGRSWFDQALRTGEFAMGDYQVGQVSGKQVLVAAWPIVENGRTVSVIAAALDVQWLNEIAAAAQLPRGSMLILVDRRGAIVARYPDAPRWVGATMPDTELVQRMREQAEGSVDVGAEDGSQRVFAFTPVRGRPDTGLRLVIGVPWETAYGAIERNQSRQILVLLLVAVLTLALALVGAERLVLRRVASLLDATRKLAAGDPAARTTLPYGQGELSDLARAFDEMASALQAREEERQRAEQALRESEDRFRAFMEHAPTMAFVKDEAGHCLYANPAFERYFQLSHQDWFGRTDLEMWPNGASAERFRRDDLRVLATGQPQQILETVDLPDGRSGHWMTVKFPLTDGSGRRLVGGVSVDVTEWRRAQAALARSERRYEQLVEQAWDGIVLADADRRLIAVNSATCAMTGYSREELLGMVVDDLVAPDDLAARQLRMEELQASRVVVSERKARRKDGSSFDVEVTARLLDNGQVQAVIRDVTARRTAEEALRDSEERYRLLYQDLPLAYQSMSEDGTLLDVNEAWLALTDLPRAGAIGTRFDELLDPESRVRFLEALARVPAAGEVQHVEAILPRSRRPAAALSIDLRMGRDERREPRVHAVLHDVTAARTAAARLRESEERYRSLFADSPVALFEEDFSGIRRHIARLEALGVTDLDAHFAAHPEELADCVESVRVVDVNKATLALYHADTRSQLSSGLDRIIGQDGYEVFTQAMVALARGERSWTSHGVNYTLDGEQIRLTLQWSVAPGAEDDWSRVLVSAMDVTVRERAEAALQESDARFARAFAWSPGPMAITTRAEGRFIDVNDAFVEAMGYTRDEVIGRTSLSLGLWLNPGDRDLLVQHLSETSGGHHREVRLRRRDGTVLEGLCTGVPVSLDADDDCILVQIVDITARKRAEEAERESERMLSTLMSNLPGMAYQCCDDDEWTMLFVSDGCRELTGYEPVDLVGNRRVSWGSLVLEEDREEVQGQVRAAIAENRPFCFVYRIRAADGEVKWVWEQGRVAKAAAGGPLILEGFVADITGQRRAEEDLRLSTEQLRQAQKMEAIGRLAGGIAHDFNNLLTAILGFADLALTHLAPDDPMVERVEEIRRAGERAAALTRQLLTFSRKQPLLPYVVSIGGVVGQMAPMLARLIGEDIELKIVEGPSGHVKADPTLIEQVVLNLVVNARDAMPRGGTLTIATSRVDLDEREAREWGSLPPGRYMELIVSDTGVGMDQATRQHLFEPFFTTKPAGQGTGLGLSTVYGIVRQSGGHIRAESEPGEGSTFAILLPLVEDVPVATAYPEAPLAAVAGNETVLIVEDEESVRRLMRSVLERHGYTVFEAADGEEALATFVANAARVQLLLTDVVMPRMDGPSLVEQVRKQHPGLPIIYLSGYGEETVPRSDPAGSTAFLQKPFSGGQLMQVVRHALDRERRAADDSHLTT